MSESFNDLTHRERNEQKHILIVTWPASPTIGTKTDNQPGLWELSITLV